MSHTARASDADAVGAARVGKPSMEPVAPSQTSVGGRAKGGDRDQPRAVRHRILPTLGKLLISLGVGILLFLVWTLWGTGLYTEREQARLGQQLDRAIAQTPDDVQSLDGDSGPPAGFKPRPGAPVFRMIVPDIDMEAVVVEGVGTEELKKGPGHYPSCRDGFDPPFCTDFEAAWPGESDRVFLSGHRTTYGAEFHRIDELDKGDDIIIESQWGRFVYSVTRQRIVEPDSRAIVVPGDRPELVLTTCAPKFSAAKRLIVYAELDQRA